MFSSQQPSETINVSDAIRPPFDANWSARRKLADALRQFNEMLLTRDVPTSALQDATDRILSETARIPQLPRVLGRHGHGERHADRGENMKDVLYEISPSTGMSNANSVPTHLWNDHGTVRGIAQPGWSQEGPVGCVHGGVIALILDQLFGVAQRTCGKPGHTGTLTIRYNKFTPLNVPLHLEASIVRNEGRKNFIHGSISVDGVRTVECHAIFIMDKAHAAPK